MAPGGAATEGKVNREMVQTLASQLNNLQQRFGSIQDLRKEQPEVFSQLKGLVEQVKHDYNIAGKQRTTEIAANFTDIPDSLVQSTVNRKAQMLGKRFDTSVKPQEKAYDGSTALPANATQAMKDARREYLKKKAGGG